MRFSWSTNRDAEVKLREMWHKGYSVTLIAEVIGCSVDACWKRKQALGLPKRKVLHTVPAETSGDWTNEQKAALRRYWNAGKSASECACELQPLRPGVTRSAVIGAAHRMGLPGRPSPIKRFQRPTWRRYVPHLFSGRQDACEWPDGCEEKATKGSYCSAHHAVTHAGKPKKKGGQFALPRAKVWI